MAARFRGSSSRWDWPKGGSPPNSPGRSSVAPSFAQGSTQKAGSRSCSKGQSQYSRKGKYKEPETGFFYCSEDGQQVLVCGKGLETADIQGMSAVLTGASVINLSYNALTAIPTGLPGCLTALDLSKNQLSHLYGLESVSNLKELYLGGNNIESTWGLSIATNLEILDLSANKIRLIEGLETLTKLKRLNLKFNKIKGMSAIRSLSFNRRLLVLDLSDNPVAEHTNYKRNILHLIPSLEVLDDLKIGFEIFRKSNDYTTRYLNTKQFNESRDPNGFGFLWSGRPGRWDGVVFQAANASATLSDQELRALSDACAGSDISTAFGTKTDGKKYPWRREPDIEPRPLQFNSAAQENEYRAKTPTKMFSPRASGGASSKSPTSYMAMSHNECYLNTVLSQHMERPEWNKYYKPTHIGTEAKVAKAEAERAKKTSKVMNRRSESNLRASAEWMDGSQAVYMGGPESPGSKGFRQPSYEYPDYEEYWEDGGTDQGSSQQRSVSERREFGENFDACSDMESNRPEYEDRSEIGVNPKELEATLLDLVEHKRALVKRLKEARAARN